MTSQQNSNVISIAISHQRDTELGFKRLAEAASRGELCGAGYTVIDADGRTHEGLLGIARVNRQLAHYGASRLAAILLWPDAEED